MRQPVSDYDLRDDLRDDSFELVGDERDGDYRRPDRRFPIALLGVLLMAVFAGGLGLAYYVGTRHAMPGSGDGGVPLIRADHSPDKVKPEQPGGMKVPDQNASIFNEKPGVPKIERLLPPPEKPMPRPVAPPPAAAPVRNTASAKAPPAGADAGTDADEDAMPVANAPSAGPAPAGRPAAQQNARAPQRDAAAVDESRPATAGSRGGKIQVRLGSLRSPDAARAEWQRLKRDNPDLLGRLSAVAVRTDLGDKGIYYRIEAGPFADRAAAERLCAQLKQRSFGCILGR